MVRELTNRDVDALIARHIEPYPGDPGIGEYRLREEDNGYPVWSVIGSITNLPFLTLWMSLSMIPSSGGLI